MADIASGQRQRPGAGGHGLPATDKLALARPVNDADDSGTDTDDEGRLIQQATASARGRGSEPPAITSQPPATAPPPPRGPASTAPATAPPTRSAAPQPPPPVPRPPLATNAKGKAAPKRPAGAITVRTLLDAGFLVPGSKVLYVEYKGNITWADLTEEGTIVCDGQAFESPSAFSIFVKRKLNPERKADDGWKAVKYAGKLLEHFKEQYLRQQLAASGLGGGALRGCTPTASLGGGGGGGFGGPSPRSSTCPSPLRQGTDGTDEDGPPSKRRRTDGDADGASGPGAGGAGRLGLKIKLKLKPGAPPPPPPPPARPGPLLPLPAPPLSTFPCGSYSRGEPGSGEAGSQPFRLQVSDMAVILMDFHAHCSSAEVGGLLAGAFDAATRTLTVNRAFPVLELQQQHRQAAAAAAGGGGGGQEAGPGAGTARPPVAVEFDATDLARVLEVIRNWGLQCVGSYRSHPAYSATPNTLDLLAAARDQQQARTAAGDEPSVCAIVAPYDPASMGAPSGAITWFYVEYDRSRPVPAAPAARDVSPLPPPPPASGFRPMSLTVETAENPTSHLDIMNLVSTQFHHTARTYAARPTRAPLGLPWRSAAATAAASGGGGSGGGGRPQTCLEKLVASVVSRLPDVFEGDLRVTYGIMVRDMVQHEFALAERVGQHRAGGGARGGGSEDGGGGWGSEGGGGGSLAAGRSRRVPRGNGVLAAVRFHSDEEETEEEDDVQLDDDDELEDDHEI